MQASQGSEDQTIPRETRNRIVAVGGALSASANVGQLAAFFELAVAHQRAADAVVAGCVAGGATLTLITGLMAFIWIGHRSDRNTSTLPQAPAPQTPTPVTPAQS